MNWIYKNNLISSLISVTFLSTCLFSCSNNGGAGYSFDNCFFVDNNSLYTEVNNNVETFNFNNKISVHTGWSYSFYKDKEGLIEISTNVIKLSIGDNYSYLLIKDSNQNKTLFTVNVRRLPIHTVSLYLYDDYESSYWTDRGETKYIVKKQLYKILTVQEKGTINISEEKPTRTGYTFLGWDYHGEKIMDNTSIFAQWNANQYTVTINNSGETIRYTATYDEYFKINVPSRPRDIPEYYNFRGCQYHKGSEHYYISASGWFYNAVNPRIRFHVLKDITLDTIWTAP